MDPLAAVASDLWPVGLLVLLGAGLVVATVVTATPPAAPLPDRDGYFDRWQRLHGGYDARTGSRYLRGWLHLAHAVARPLARLGVWPNLLTLWTVWLALAALVAAAAGGRWPLLAGAIVVCSGLGDTLDGCVAALTGRATAWGYVVDSLTDRINDVIYLVALVSLGAPVGLAVTCGVAFFLLEYTRARSGNAGGSVVGVVTVGERANRVIFCALGLLAAGTAPARAQLVVTFALAVLTLLSLVGLAQLIATVRRDLLRGADHPGDDLGGEQHERKTAAGMSGTTDEEQPGNR